MKQNQPIEIDIPDISVGKARGIVLIIVLALLAWTSFYQAPTDSIGVILRFGKHVGESTPGLHMKMPLGIDRVVIVPVERQLKLEFGLLQRTPGATNLWQQAENPHKERSMVTGDLNAAVVEWAVTYRIEDPKMYLFSVRDPEATLRDLSEAAVREAVGDRTVDEIITTGRSETQLVSTNRLRELVKLYDVGFYIDQVQLMDVGPPEAVQDSFSDVNRAQQDRENMINLAQGNYNKEVPRAKGEADKIIQGAEGYRFKRVNEAEGDAALFTSIFKEYQKAPDVTGARLYLETMAAVLPQAGPKTIAEEGLLRILPLAPGTATPTR
jgi:modulator of FtsH protease HflK